MRVHIEDVFFYDVNRNTYLVSIHGVPHKPIAKGKTEMVRDYQLKENLEILLRPTKPATNPFLIRSTNTEIFDIREYS